MASYFVKYNNIILTNMIRVRTVNTTVLPPRENNAITIWERPGGIYNSYRYGEREITVTFLVMVSKEEYRNNPNSIDAKITAIGNAFKVDEPKPLYLGTSSKYIYAVPEGDFKMTELRYDCYECEIMFKCYDPQYYSSGAKTYSNKTTGARTLSNNPSVIDVYNAGNSVTYPIITIGINKDNTSFVQVENATNGDKVLIGDYPSSDKEALVAARDTMIDDEMNDRTLWSTSSIPTLDTDRGIGGSFKTTSNGDGLMISSVGGSGTWKGVAGKRSLSTALSDFSVQVRMSHNSTGVNGDPTQTNLKETLDDIISGERTEFYKVSAPILEVRENASTTARIVGTLEKGTNVYPKSITNGWAQIDSPVYGYCYVKNLKKYYSDGTRTYTAKNVTAREDVELRSAAADDSTSLLLATIPAGTHIRVYALEENGFYKLYIPYNGNIGYVDSSKVTDYEGVTLGYPSVEYPEEEYKISSDGKTGVCEVYGYTKDGVKLFKLSLADDNEYYELTKPAIQVGSETILQDNTSGTPNKETSYLGDTEQLTVTHDYLLSGEQDNWNDFYGELGIQRQNGKWSAWIYKIKDGSTVKKLTFNAQDVVDSPEGELGVIVIYMGTQKSGSMSGMCISDVKVKRLNSIDPTTQNIAKFNRGDEIQIDCYNNKVYLNNQLYYDIDIGSKFIELVSGNNSMKVVSDDPDILATIMFNERYL